MLHDFLYGDDFERVRLIQNEVKAIQGLPNQLIVGTRFEIVTESIQQSISLYQGQISSLILEKESDDTKMRTVRINRTMLNKVAVGFLSPRVIR